MIVVLDTNILISACLKPEGNEAAVVRQGLRGEWRWAASEAILAEYRDVLRRPKFLKYAEEAEVLLGQLPGAVAMVEPGERLSVCSDEDDNRLLECAVAGGAEFLVTGNGRHFPERYGSTRIVNARRFLERE